MQKIIDKVDWEKVPLLPVIVQDKDSKAVLMMAFMDKEALTLTLQTKQAHYFSRTKQRIWKKGESSGNFQNIEDIFIDCDNDTLLITIEQVGGIACHTGRKSCFFTKLDSDEIVSKVDESATQKYSVIDKLYHTLKEKKTADPKTSYTASLLAKGENSYLKKVVEEAGEFCFAVKDNNKDEIIYECADLVYHTLVALVDKGVDPDRVKQELTKRFNQSGIEEKNSRT
ncbi:MAG TPA: bifunctional phosphoribosyl-AMP cyclohydrolase/phosphoribosyl-ATP diphosphatase HisIE [Campylobacterales bacterium]|nr:bifunctional phosphoribosyl-AMP cyclohydrolase/phosphoribosyl-ATP diphosphatase HisIE [Campylobacterales bacterium]